MSFESKIIEKILIKFADLSFHWHKCKSNGCKSYSQRLLPSNTKGKKSYFLFQFLYHFREVEDKQKFKLKTKTSPAIPSTPIISYSTTIYFVVISYHSY